MVQHLTSYILTAFIATGFFTGTFGLLVWVRQRDQKIYRTFGVFCWSLVVYWIALLWLVSQVELEGRLPAARALQATAALLSVAYVWFVAAYGSRRDRAVRIVTAVIWGLFFVGAVLAPTGIFFTNLSGMTPLHLPWGEVVYKEVGEPLVWGQLYFVCLFLIRAYAIFVVASLARAGEKGRAVALAVFVGIDTVGLVSEAMVIFFDLEFILASQFSTFIAMVSMTLYFSDELRSRTVALKRANIDLEQSELKFRSIAENSIVGILILQDECIRFINEAGAKIFSLTPEEMLALEPGGYHRLVHEEDRAFVITQARRKQRLEDAEDITPNYEFRVLTAGGSTRWVEIHSTTMDLMGKSADLVLLLDITDRRILEEQIAHSRRMDAIGRLAGGIAHDFNNILQTLTSSCELILTNVTSEGEAEEDNRSLLTIIQSQTERAATLTRQLLTLSRKKPFELKAIELNRVVREYHSLLSRTFGTQFQVTFTPTNTPSWIRGDVAQLEQVLLNLCMNSRDALPTGGNIDIETAVVELETTFTSLHGECPAGRFVVLSVTDNGLGMDRATLTHIFEPFFTTKQIGAGTGLGLAMVFGIVQNHHGAIDVESEVGQGTKFRIYLPCVDPEPDTAHVDRSSAALSGRGTILLAEDDDVSRVLTVKVLEKAGYKVIQAEDGQDAIEVARERYEELDLAILDVIMPSASGRAVCDVLHTLRPELPVIFISGYTSDIIDEETPLDSKCPILAKPFSHTEFLECVRQCILSRSADLGDRP